jgi:hypothetical protein
MLPIALLLQVAVHESLRVFLLHRPPGAPAEVDGAVDALAAARLQPHVTAEAEVGHGVADVDQLVVVAHFFLG